MEFFKRIFIVLILVINIYNVNAQVFSDVYAKLQQSQILNDHFFGFSLYDLDSNRYVVDINGHKHFTPASNTKVFTLYTALEMLGDSIPGLQYVEKGDSLLFWGTGDPTFLHSKMDSHVVYNFLKKTEKKLFFIPTPMQNRFFAAGWTMDDFDSYYQPEIATFPIYGNVVTFRENSNNGLKLVPYLFQEKLTIDHSLDKGKFTLSRSFVENQFLQSREKVPSNYVNEIPFKYSDTLAIRLLSDTLNKSIQIIEYSKPTEVKTLYSNATRYVLREMMLPSDNYLAEQILMMISLQKFKMFDTYLVRNWMKDHYFKYYSDEIVLHDGSGLSSYNKITPQNMIDVLVAIKNKLPDESQRFKLFSTGGVDGTLKRSYSTDRGVPFVFAKTGTITSVYCQSGYLITRSGKKLAFSFLNNNFIDERSAIIRKEMVNIMTYIRQNY
ncbi:D-alanyl-D-alanine carboxypeptidase [Sphingobacterium sp. JUb56]|uniref:D-alanyl-D-alanine carboxypeptidase n=1 Tax=Sphingobacterium sp. JUb56 TaxID=2587145 RepID=UPI0016177C54|nr:D-alanyl-D-alanine carboxypeptidase [Sphingobacterium sp. JUb56]MBB2952361.1 D-alanyl-D-alanine carboxypeptidase/D-alanyl-D-alanine-endopeptidase (penicillin-binding protein 4) [Sphingobacterium sp. JUb56]